MVKARQIGSQSTVRTRQIKCEFTVEARQIGGWIEDNFTAEAEQIISNQSKTAATATATATRIRQQQC